MNEERNAKNGNEYGQKLALGDAVPHGCIGFLVALAGDAGGSIDESEECRENAGGGVAPEQTDGEEHNEDNQTFAHGFEQLGRVSGIQELTECFTGCIVFTADAGEGVEEGFAGLRQIADAIACGVFYRCHGLNLLLRGEGEKLLGELHGNGIGGLCDSAIEFAIDKIGNSAKEEADGTDDGYAVDKLHSGYLVFPCVPDAGDDDCQDAAVRGHAAFPYAENPGRVIQETAESVLGKPVEKEFAQSAAEKHAADADECHEITQFFLFDAEKIPLAELQQYIVTQNKAGNVGQTIPAQGEWSAGDINDDGVEVVNVSSNAHHDCQIYSTGQGGKQGKNISRALRAKQAECSFFQKK